LFAGEIQEEVERLRAYLGGPETGSDFTSSVFS